MPENISQHGEVADAEHLRSPELDAETESDIDTFGLFLRQIGKVALLDAATEVELAKAIEAGLYAEQILSGAVSTSVQASREELEFLASEGRAAKTRFLEANARLAVSIAKKYRGHSLELSDRVQNGATGLVRAVEKFDFKKGYKFSTYATWWIKQKIDRAEADTSRVIRLPYHLDGRLKKVRRVHATLGERLQREPTDDELSQEAGFDVAEFASEIYQAQHTVSLSALVGDSSTELGELNAAVDEPGYEAIEQSDTAQRLRKAIAQSSLKPREKEIIALRFGLGGRRVHQLKELAEHYDVSPERIRQLERQALRKLANDSDIIALAE